MVTAEMPTSHIRVLKGDAKIPSTVAMPIKPVYSWDVVIGPKGVERSAPWRRLIPVKPATTNTMTKNKSKLVSSV